MTSIGTTVSLRIVQISREWRNGKDNGNYLSGVAYIDTVVYTYTHAKTSLDVLKELKDYGLTGITGNQMETRKTKKMTWKLGLY